MKLRTLGLALTLGALGVPALAAPVVNATKIRVTNATGTWLQVAELQAFTFAALNVAAAANGAMAVGTGGTYDAFATAAKAIDGNTGGNYYRDTIFHPRVLDGSMGGMPSLEVAFSPATLASLTIYGRTDCCSDRDQYSISIFNASDRLLFSGNVDARNGPVSVLFDPVSGAIPEPATWAMMIFGFGLVGNAMRYRRRRTSVAFSA